MRVQHTHYTYTKQHLLLHTKLMWVQYVQYTYIHTPAPAITHKCECVCVSVCVCVCVCGCVVLVCGLALSIMLLACSCCGRYCPHHMTTYCSVKCCEVSCSRLCATWANLRKKCSSLTWSRLIEVLDNHIWRWGDCHLTCNDHMSLAPCCVQLWCDLLPL